MGWLRRLLVALIVMVVIARVANDDTVDFSGVEMTLSAEDIVNAILPKVISALATNTALQNALVAAIMPQVRAQMATIARATAGAGTTTPRTGP